MRIRNKNKNIRLPKFKDTILMLPNLLTYLRIIFVPIIMVILYYEAKTSESYWGFIAAGLFILAAATDFLDGYYARKMKIKSAVGKIIDPLADKLLVLCILIMLIPMYRVPAFLVVIVVFREFIITALRTLASVAGIIIPADTLGKIKTVFQMTGLPLILLDIDLGFIHFYELGLIFILISIFFSMFSAFLYTKKFFEQAKDREF